MQYVIQSSSILTAALQHAMKDVLGLADAFMETSAAGPHSVTMNGRTYRGLEAVLLALRMQATTAEQRAFFGDSEDAEQAALVNQWVAVAALLEVDAVRASNDATASVAKAVYTDVEKILATTPNGSAQHLTGSPRATIADLLVYAAAFNHPLHAEALPTTLAWAAHAQQDAYLAPLRSSVVTAHHKAQKAAGASAAAAGRAAEVTYVKPSEEEILRRRAEKEKAKMAKAAAAAGKNGGTSAPSAADDKKASASPSTKGKKAELDSTNLDIRVGQLTNLRRHPDADRLYVEDMVLGSETRVVVSGLVQHYQQADLEGTYCLVVCNMKPRPLMGVTSHGMVLCAEKGDTVRLIRPPAGAKCGDRVLFGANYDATVAAAPPPEPVPGNKMGEVLSHLHTNNKGVLCWKEEPALLASGEKVTIAEMPDCLVK